MKLKIDSAFFKFLTVVSGIGAFFVTKAAHAGWCDCKCEDGKRSYTYLTSDATCSAYDGEECGSSGHWYSFDPEWSCTYGANTGRIGSSGSSGSSSPVVSSSSYRSQS